MKTAVIRQRVADFLKQHPPFDSFSEQDLLDLAGSGRVKFHEADEYVQQQGDSKGQQVWVIQQGRVQIVDQRGAAEQLRDVLGPGDILGLDPFIADGACRYSARTASDVILYGVLGTLFESVVSRYAAAKRFLAAHTSVSGIHGFNRASWLDTELPPIDFFRARLLTFAPYMEAEEIASCLRRSTSGAGAMVDEENRLLRVVTAADLFSGRAGGSCPTIAPSNLMVRQVTQRLLKTRTEAIAVTADGTTEGSLQAVVTASDVALFAGHDPVRLINSIRRAALPVETKPLLRRARDLILDGMAKPTDADDCCRIGYEIMSAAIESAINQARGAVAAKGIRDPEVPHCWLTFGEAARGEALRPVLPTLAIAYADTVDNKPACVYFRALAEETIRRLEELEPSVESRIVLEPGQHSMPIAEWMQLYSETIRNPFESNIYARRDLFDLRSVFGDVSLIERLRNHITSELQESPVTITLLANDSLEHMPPLTFFQGMVLGLDGAQSDSLDIYETMLYPIADSARVFAIAKGRPQPSNTLERLVAAATDFPNGATVLRESADAYRTALYYEALAGGSRLQPGEFSKFDQQLLKTTFSSIQRLLEFTASSFLEPA